MNTMGRLGQVRGVNATVPSGVAPDSGGWFGVQSFQAQGNVGAGAGVGVQATGVLVLVLLGLVVWAHLGLK